MSRISVHSDSVARSFIRKNTEQASRLTQAVAVFRIQQEQQKAREFASAKSVAAPVAARKPATADAGDNWETF